MNVATEFLRPSGEPATVLVVDDEAYNVDLLCQELEDLGLDVETASNGRAALEMLDSIDCDLVLLDIMMPEMDGLAVLETLNRAERIASLPVVMVSNSST